MRGGNARSGPHRRSRATFDPDGRPGPEPLTGGPAADELILVPRPRHLEVTGLGPPAGECAVAATVDRSLPPQGFELTMTATDGARIVHRDEAGRRYAMSLVEQLSAQPVEGRVAAVHVQDHPDLAVRAYMLDVSRDRVPTRATLERFVGLLALARYNQFQLYVEHTFAHAGHEQVWRDASPLTPDDLRWLDRRCAENGVELVVNRNCFGHFERWLRHDRYRHRAEAPDGVEVIPGVRFPPGVLAPTPDNAEFALGLLREMLADVASTSVNIGCDETFELGRGASTDACAERGKGAVYMEHVRRLAGPLCDDGYDVQMWADVLRRHPDLAATLPASITPIVWSYEAPRPPETVPDLSPDLVTMLDEVGIDVDVSGGFTAAVRPLAEAGVGFWVASGTSCWNSLVGRTTNAYPNLVDAVSVALDHGSTGHLVTDWGDGGHHHPPSVSFGPLIHGGAVAWCLEANRDLAVAPVLDVFVFNDRSGRLGGAVEALGRLWSETGRKAFNASPLAAALFPHLPLLVTGRPEPGAVAGVIEQIDRSLAAIEASQPECDDRDEVVAELTQAARLARLGAARLLGAGGPPREEQRRQLRDLIDQQRSTWLARSRPGGLEDSIRHFDAALR